MRVDMGAEPLESGNPVNDPRSFRRCLGQYATGVTIITTKAGEELAGVTANSFASVSLDPPLILWSISRTSRSFALFDCCEHFTINVLARDQASVSQHFSSAETDKFAAISWQEGLGGVPSILGSIASFECSVEARYPGGDHVILLGRVENFVRFEGEPLLFSQGRYGVAEEHPDFVAAQTAGSAGSAAPQDNGSALLPVLFDAYQQMSARFEEHRAAEGVTVVEGRTLAALFSKPGSSVDEVAQQTFLGQRDASDAIAALIERQLVKRDAENKLTLTERGTKLRLAVRERWQRFQDDELKIIPSEDVEVVRRTLMKLIDRAA